MPSRSAKIVGHGPKGFEPKISSTTATDKADIAQDLIFYSAAESTSRKTIPITYYVNHIFL